jgi:hypothetical protein
MNKDRNIIVVGDGFSNLAKQNNTIIFSKFENLLEDIKDVPYQPYKFIFHIGQGLNDAQISYIQKKIRGENALINRVMIKTNILLPRSNEFLTHKRIEKNRLVSEPILISPDEYVAYLMIDDQCAEMSDHVTGQHLQGMVLVEAARQLTLAVTEKFFIEDKNRKSVSFVTQKLETTFKEYAFPIETCMYYKINNIRGINPINRTFKVTITFIQNEQVVVTVNYEFSIFSKVFLQEKEDMAAKKAINKIITQRREYHDLTA